MLAQLQQQLGATSAWATASMPLPPQQHQRQQHQLPASPHSTSLFGSSPPFFGMGAALQGSSGDIAGTGLQSPLGSSFDGTTCGDLIPVFAGSSNSVAFSGAAPAHGTGGYARSTLGRGHVLHALQHVQMPGQPNQQQQQQMSADPAGSALASLGSSPAASTTLLHMRQQLSVAAAASTAGSSVNLAACTPLGSSPVSAGSLLLQPQVLGLHGMLGAGAAGQHSDMATVAYLSPQGSAVTNIAGGGPLLVTPPASSGYPAPWAFDTTALAPSAAAAPPMHPPADGGACAATATAAAATRAASGLALCAAAAATAGLSAAAVAAQQKLQQLLAVEQLQQQLEQEVLRLLPLI
jgi:hypothetical protein